MVRQGAHECEPLKIGGHRQNGKRLGRPATAALHADRVRKLRRSGAWGEFAGRGWTRGHTRQRETGFVVLAAGQKPYANRPVERPPQTWVDAITRFLQQWQLQFDGDN